MELETRENVQAQAANQTAYRTLFRNVYTWMALALLITAAASWVVASTPALVELIIGQRFVFWGLLLGELALVWYLSSRINKLSFQTASLFFVIYSVMNGLTLSIIFLIYTHASIVTTFLITAGMFGAMALIGTFTKKDLSSWGSILLMALIGLIIASVVNLFLGSSILYWAVTFIGIIIFVGLTIYDANKIKRALQAHGHEVNDSTQKIALMGALSLYLDFINLFLLLLRIFGGRR
ncbi:Bax inhibitor-1/YccA family protein [Dysgonomonas sp. 25]|uniref:Bax inhibitor-1/YccA family protein n=1 Tax=Dysgonomonas sp. 25 TaxID=2302933 RepID=UPI0013D41F24|nr:Bax inhibitor-1/YccA family protein [Dysgonomonas sp. 25]NDV68423.1 BAX inhibitor (BI)-1/YccA family protein [Dysgonomonas sp. 25]